MLKCQLMCFIIWTGIFDRPAVHDVFPGEVLMYISGTESRISRFTLTSFSFPVIKLFCLSEFIAPWNIQIYNPRKIYVIISYR